MNIKTSLEETVCKSIDKLEKMEVGSDEYKATVDGLTKLADRVIEIEKIEIEKQERICDRENDNEFRMIQIDDERKDRFIKNCLTGVTIVTGVGLTVWGTLKSLKFEETGTVTTIMGRGFINKLLPKK